MLGKQLRLPENVKVDIMGEQCSSHTVKMFGRGILNRCTAWTPFYQRPKKRSAQHFIAKNKISGVEMFVLIKCLVYCESCKVLLIFGKQMNVTNYTLGTTFLSTLYVLNHLGETVSLLAEDYVFKPVFYMPSQNLQFLSAVNHVVTSD